MRTLLPAPPEAGSPAPLRRAAFFTLIAVASLAALGAVSLVGMRLARTGALPGVEVSGVPVGGLDDGAVRAAIHDLGERRQRAQVTVVLDDARVSATAADVGYRFDADATVDAVLRRGRQANPAAALADHLRAFWGTLVVQPVHHVDDSRFDPWLDGAVEALSQNPIEGTLEFDGAHITRVDPRPGVLVDPAGLRSRVSAGLLDDEPDTVVRAAEDPVEPETTVEDVDAVLARAEQAVSAPVTLVHDDVRVTLDPDTVGSSLVVARDGGDLRLRADAARLTAAIDPATLERLDTPAVDAAFSASAGSVQLTPARNGFRFDAEATAEQLVAVVTADGPREAPLAGEVVEPDLSTEEAEALGIVERVSTFTTEFAAGQSRVTNIHRIAELVDGVLLRPGETFSVNDHVGPRTPEKGFVGGGAIFDGEFVEQVGGGVSQFATTMYNAAYFGGYAIPDHKAHSYYISRYPVGREATLNYPNVDLKVRNNSPHGALVTTSYTPTSVTVSFYGTRWVDVDSVAGERQNVTPPPVEVRENADLPPGEDRVVQEGREGFDITVTRVLTYPDGRVEEEREFTRYLPEPRIVERGP